LQIHNAFKPNFLQKTSRLRQYKPFALQNLLYGSEIWTIKETKKNYTP